MYFLEAYPILFVIVTPIDISTLKYLQKYFYNCSVGNYFIILKFVTTDDIQTVSTNFYRYPELSHHKIGEFTNVFKYNHSDFSGYTINVLYNAQSSSKFIEFRTRTLGVDGWIQFVSILI